MTDRRRALPSVDRLLNDPALAPLVAAQPRSLVVEAARAVLAGARRAGSGLDRDGAAWAAAIAAQLRADATPTLRRVVNATGVVLHTNLGRAPLAAEAIAAIADAAAGYTSLEYDLAGGRRGSRHVHCAALLTTLTGAADALVVNNAASALLLVLAAAAEGGAAVVSRGELIEIGGGFRIPEIMEKAGVRLIEVGTTNRTRLADYARALAPRRGKAAADARPVLLKVHRSNFRLEGFTADAELGELVALGRRRKTAVFYDLGGGLLADLGDTGLVGEPRVQDGVRAGTDAVVFSGDKLLGGPQAGIIAGSKRFVAACRAHPLARAARADKLTLAGLAATLTLYRDPSSVRERVPVLRMLAARPAELEPLAQRLAAALPGAAHATVVTTRAAVGGGAFPGITLESRGVAIATERAGVDALARALRDAPTPVIATVERGRVVLDVRTLLPGDEARIAAAVATALA